MKIDTESFLRFLVASSLVLLVWVTVAGCEKASLGDGMGDGGSASDFHGAGWLEEDRHGLAFLGDIASCNSCHGEKLTGGASEVSCQTCHPGWEGDCTFCHGGMHNDTGAPPFDVKGETDRKSPGVGAHSVHVEDAESHVAFPCEACHGSLVKSYTDVRHFEGRGTDAEVTFSGVWGTGGLYDRNTATCSQVYCHGDGQTRSGDVSWVSDEAMDCDACHGFRDNLEGMSGWHGLHLRLNQFGCEACHSRVMDAQGRFNNRALHINGVRDVDLASGSYDEGTGTCSTSCHETMAAWSGDYHSEGWVDPTQHGYAFFHDHDSCETCHGTPLRGGSSGVSCDSCHTGGTPAWRTDCTFCHGGIDNSSGAPPEGVYGETARTFAAVGAHTAHVQETDTHAAYDCTMCHSKPVSFDDPDHIDSNNGVEVQFAAPAGAGAIYSPSTTQCASLYCHGNGRSPSGQVGWTFDMRIACDSCHGYTTNPGDLSGDHRKHINEGIRCSSCHAPVVDDSGRIIDRALHTDGDKNVSFSGGGVYSPGTQTCSSITCHERKRW